jgi:hypothetical protein
LSILQTGRGIGKGKDRFFPSSSYTSTSASASAFACLKNDYTNSEYFFYTIFGMKKLKVLIVDDVASVEFLDLSSEGTKTIQQLLDSL